MASGVLRRRRRRARQGKGGRIELRPFQFGLSRGQAASTIGLGDGLKNALVMGERSLALVLSGLADCLADGSKPRRSAGRARPNVCDLAHCNKMLNLSIP